MTSPRLRIAVQSKGRLAEGGMDLLKRCGLRFAYGRDKLHQRAENMPVDLMLVRDDDIPNFVASGACDYGIVGENVLREEQAAAEEEAKLRAEEDEDGAGEATNDGLETVDDAPQPPTPATTTP